MNTTILWQILLQLVLIALNAVFACAEIAVISLKESRLEQLSEQGSKSARRLLSLTQQPARFLATIQVAITLAGFLGSAFAADNFADYLTQWLLSLGVPIPAATLNTISVVVITIILSYFTLILGELVPKRLAMKKAETLALAMSGMLTAVSKLFAPIVWVLTASTNGMLRLFRVDPNEDEDEVTEEEIRMLVDAGGRKGILDAEETAFIQNVFEFDDLTAGEFATHRTDLTILWMEDSPEEWDQILRASRHTMYPVCEGTADHLLGVLNIKDYFYLTDRSRESILAHAVKPAYFVPESVRADVLFRRMKESGNRFAIVMDEYGGMAGVVTMNDLLEQLVGDLDPADESEEGKLEKLEQLDEHTWSIGGGVPLDEVAKALSLPLPVERFDTFSGFVLGHYGLIPPDGQTLDLTMDGMQIHVVSIREHRIEQAIVTKLPQ